MGADKDDGEGSDRPVPAKMGACNDCANRKIRATYTKPTTAGSPDRIPSSGILFPTRKPDSTAAASSSIGWVKSPNVYTSLPPANAEEDAGNVSKQRGSWP